MEDPPEGLEFLEGDVQHQLEVLDIDIVIGDEEYQADALKALKIDERKVTEQLRDQPATHAWFGSLLTSARRQLQELKTNYKIWRAKQDRAWRAKDRDPSDPFTFKTEKDLKAKIRSLEGYREWKEAIAQAEYQVEILEVLSEASEQRHNALTMIEKRKRQEEERNRRLQEGPVADDEVPVEESV